MKKCYSFIRLAQYLWDLKIKRFLYLQRKMVFFSILDLTDFSANLSNHPRYMAYFYKICKRGLHIHKISLFKLKYWSTKDPNCIFYLLNDRCRVTKRIYMKWIWHMLSYTRQSSICHLLDNCFLLTRRCWGLCRSKVEECCFGDRCSCGWRG